MGVSRGPDTTVRGLDFFFLAPSAAAAGTQTHRTATAESAIAAAWQRRALGMRHRTSAVLEVGTPSYEKGSRLGRNIFRSKFWSDH